MNGYQFVRICEEGQSKIYSGRNDFSQLAGYGSLCRNAIVMQNPLAHICTLFPVHDENGHRSFSSAISSCLGSKSLGVRAIFGNLHSHRHPRLGMAFACRCGALFLSLVLAAAWRIDDNSTTTEMFVEYDSHLPQQDTMIMGAQQVAPKKPFRRHIVAIGDLHGDMANARRVLEFSGVVDENLDWSGKVDILVQTGDIIDR
jgi:hypothetical protein